MRAFSLMTEAQHVLPESSTGSSLQRVCVCGGGAHPLWDWEHELLFCFVLGHVLGTHTHTNIPSLFCILLHLLSWQTFAPIFGPLTNYSIHYSILPPWKKRHKPKSKTGIISLPPPPEIRISEQKLNFHTAFSFFLCFFFYLELWFVNDCF